MIYLGIDPAFRVNGTAVAIVDETDKLHKTVRLKKFNTFLHLLLWLWDRQEVPSRGVACCVENSNLQDVTFDMRGSVPMVAKRSRNVGANQAASQYTYEAVVYRFGKDHAWEISPQKKGKKWGNGNIRSARQYLTGVLRSENHNLIWIDGKTITQDMIDAYQLALIAKKNFSFAQANIKLL